MSKKQQQQEKENTVIKREKMEMKMKMKLCFFCVGNVKKSVVDKSHSFSSIDLYFYYIYDIYHLYYWINRLTLLLFLLYIMLWSFNLFYFSSALDILLNDYISNNCTLFNSWFLLYSKYTILIKVKKKNTK